MAGGYQFLDDLLGLIGHGIQVYRVKGSLCPD
jgi:hypothetical protein